METSSGTRPVKLTGQKISMSLEKNAPGPVGLIVWRMLSFASTIYLLLFCHTQRITSRIKTIINRLINIELKIFTLLGRSDCGGETS